MNKSDLEDAVRELTAYRHRKEEEERRNKWVQRKCIAVGMALMGVIYKIAGWTVENYERLYAAWGAFFSAKGGS